MLGLDLKGGTELVYQGRPTPQVPEVTPEDIDRAIEIIRERVDSLGVSEPEISRVGEDQIEVGLPERLERPAGDRADRDHRAALPLRLRAERHPAEPGRPGPDGAARTTALIDAVAGRLEAAAGLGRAVREAGLHGERRHLLPVRREHARADRRAVGDARRTSSRTRRRQAARRTPRCSRSRRARSCSRTSPTTTRDHRRRRVRRPAVAVLRPPRQARPHRRRDHRPEAGHRPVQPADRRLQLHRRGPRGVPDVTRTIAQRGADDCFAATGTPVRRDLVQPGRPVLGLVRDRPRRRAHLAPDHQLRRQPGRDRRPHRRPDLRASRPRRPRTSPRCCRSAPCRSSSR